MIVKIYGMIWAFIATIAALFALTGNFTELTAVVFGFISFGMIFMGMMGVLPSTMGHNAPKVTKKEKTPVKEEKAVEVFPASAVHAR